MNFKGLTGKITKNIDTIGLLGGSLTTLNKVWPDAPVLEKFQYVLEAALKDPHFPNLGNLQFDLLNGYAKEPLMNMVKIALLGEVASMLGIAPKYANMAKKLGWSGAKGVALTALIMRSTVWHSPNTGNPGASTMRNFSSAPTVDSYAY